MFWGDVELKDMKLHTSEDGYYYLSLTYTEDRDDGVYEHYFPKALLNLWNEPVLEINSVETFLNIGFGSMLLCRNEETGGVYVERKIKDKPPKKMTISEIEKELGYKIEVVSEK